MGFMGSGKTTFATALSYELKKSMIDTDKWIERTEHRTINDIFASEGEEAFRQMEYQCLMKLC